MKAILLAAILILAGCSTNPTTGAKTIDWAKLVAGIETGCAHQVQAEAAISAASAAISLSLASVGFINPVETLISIGCALLPAPAA